MGGILTVLDHKEGVEVSFVVISENKEREKTINVQIMIFRD